jgi:hypothetical protein
MTYVTNHSAPQHSRFNSFVIGVFSALIAVGAGVLSLAGFVAA